MNSGIRDVSGVAAVGVAAGPRRLRAELQLGAAFLSIIYQDNISQSVHFNEIRIRSAVEKMFHLWCSRPVGLCWSSAAAGGSPLKSRGRNI